MKGYGYPATVDDTCVAITQASNDPNKHFTPECKKGSGTFVVDGVEFPGRETMINGTLIEDLQT